MKVLAVDYGEKKMGLAISDETGSVSSKLPVLFIKKKENRIDGIVYLIKEFRPQALLIGLPKNLSGDDTEQTRIIKTYIEELKKELAKVFGSDAPDIVTWDESYSSRNAEIGKTRKYKRTWADSEAARLVLQEFLDSPDGLKTLRD